MCANVAGCDVSGCTSSRKAHTILRCNSFFEHKKLFVSCPADAKSEIEEINGNDNETRTRYFIQEINCTGAGAAQRIETIIIILRGQSSVHLIPSPRLNHCRLQLIILKAPAEDFRTKAKLIECGLKFWWSFLMQFYAEHHFAFIISIRSDPEWNRAQSNLSREKPYGNNFVFFDWWKLF